jgi:hypothetical protein
MSEKGERSEQRFFLIAHWQLQLGNGKLGSPTERTVTAPEAQGDGEKGEEEHDGGSGNESLKADYHSLPTQQLEQTVPLA